MPLPTIPSGNVASATASTTYTVDNSCRFNTADSARMAITFGGAGTSSRIATFSFWFKRSNLTVDEELLYRISDDSGNYFNIAFSSTDTWKIKQSISSVNLEFVSNAVYRDPSAWMHLLVVFDTTQATEGNRVKIYVNGTQVTSWSTSTYPSQDTDMLFGTANINSIATSGAANCFGGYLAEVCYCDGQALTTTDFGEFDEDSPTIWKPKDVSGLTFGDNGFYLDFGDSADLGADVSGNSNDLTPTNLDATDQATDTPTNNFCTMNPLDNYYFDGTFSQGNCHLVSDASTQAYVTGTLGMTAGKWYWEIEFDARSIADYDYSRIGFAGIMADDASAGFAGLGSQAHNYAYYGINGYGYYSGSGADLGTTYTVGDIISVALDLTNGKVYYAKNGTWVNSGDPESGATGTGAQTVLAASTTPIGAYLPALNQVDNTSTGTWKCNFGGCSAFTVSSANQDADGYGNFEYAVPSGYYALCTKNLAEYG
jgi:hypothetical protein